MFEQFEAYIRSHTALTQDDLSRLKATCIPKKLRRRQLLMKEGEVFQQKVFVCQGLLATYLRKDDGAEYIMRFSPENTWTIAHEGYNHQSPSKFHIEALEDSQLLLWPRAAFNELVEAIPVLRDYSERLKTMSLEASHERIMMTISSTSEEKYENFIATFPDVFRRVPLHMVASYLGVSRETLSRIRHAQMKK